MYYTLRRGWSLGYGSGRSKRPLLNKWRHTEHRDNSIKTWIYVFLHEPLKLFFWCKNQLQCKLRLPAPLGSKKDHFILLAKHKDNDLEQLRGSCGEAGRGPGSLARIEAGSRNHGRGQSKVVLVFRGSENFLPKLPASPTSSYKGPWLHCFTNGLLDKSLGLAESEGF